MELLTVWFVGILAALGAFECYITYGFSDAAYQYIETGLAEMVLLFVISHLSDEQYKLNAVRMYMVDYLENNCAFHVKRQRTTDREELNVIAAENTGKQEWEEKKGEREIHKMCIRDRSGTMQQRRTQDDGSWWIVWRCLSFFKLVHTRVIWLRR